jgi:hypothetical protein
MGDTIWVLKEGQDEDDWDHSLILTEEKEFKRLSKELGLKKFDELLDYSILNEESGDPNTEPNYLDPSEARLTLESFISAIKTGQSKIKAAEDVLEELEDCLKKIIEAENEHCKVRLAVVP